MTPDQGNETFDDIVARTRRNQTLVDRNLNIAMVFVIIAELLAIATLVIAIWRLL